MTEIRTNPPKPRRRIAVALEHASWPAWAPRPADPDPTPAGGQAARSVAEVRSQASDAPRGRGGQSEESRKEQIQLVRVIGARLREGRELAGLSQIDAAKLLGYANSSKLAKIEAASDTNSVPMTTIRRAAELYDVSVDFLFGLTSDWERDPKIARERAVGAWLHNYLQEVRARDALAFVELSRLLEAVSSLIPNLATGAEQAKAAFERFMDMNPSYNDLIGGARLQSLIESLDDSGRHARLALKRLHVDLAGAGVAGVQS